MIKTQTTLTLAAAVLTGLTACGSGSDSDPTATNTMTTPDGRTLGAFGTGYTVTVDGVDYGYECDADQTAWVPVDADNHPVTGMPTCFDASYSDAEIVAMFGDD